MSSEEPNALSGLSRSLQRPDAPRTILREHQRQTSKIDGLGTFRQKQAGKKLHERFFPHVSFILVVLPFFFTQHFNPDIRFLLVFHLGTHVTAHLDRDLGSAEPPVSRKERRIGWERLGPLPFGAERGQSKPMK